MGAPLTIADNLPAEEAVVADTSSSLAVASPVVSVSIGDGVQPGQPLRLSYELPAESERPDGVIPVLISRSANGDYRFEGAVGGENNRISADVSHLSWSQFGWFDVDAFVRSATNAVESALGTGFPKPDCVGQPVQYASQTTRITAVANDVAWTCVMTTPGSDAIEPTESVQLASNSPFA
ncbi:hypothetical protein GS676_21290 [Rhodococcus hoagii]|nr:hypothetical protein [Prescottella equi]